MTKTQKERLYKYTEQIKEIWNKIENIKDEEEEKLENIPENLQTSELYEKIEEGIENLEDILGILEEGIENLEDIYIEYL